MEKQKIYGLGYEKFGYYIYFLNDGITVYDNKMNKIKVTVTSLKHGIIYP